MGRDDLRSFVPNLEIFEISQFFIFSLFWRESKAIIHKEQEAACSINIGIEQQSKNSVGRML